MASVDESVEREALVEQIAEAIFITEHGEFSEDYHPDHNRWTWQGDGHHENYKATFRTYARAVLPVVAAQVKAAEERIERLNDEIRRTEYCWTENGNRSVWPTAEEARTDAIAQGHRGAAIQRREVVISDWREERRP